MNEMRSNATSEIDKRKDLKLGGNKVECMGVALSRVFNVSLFVSISFYSGLTPRSPAP